MHLEFKQLKSIIGRFKVYELINKDFVLHNVEVTGVSKILKIPQGFILDIYCFCNYK